MRILTVFTTTIALCVAPSLFGCSTNQSLLEQQTSGGGGDDVSGGGDCTLTQGFWKNHEEAWPVTTLTLGSVSYSQPELLAILNQPVAGNGLIALSHQLIAAKLNVASGAGSVGDIAAADALIGALVVPPVGNGYLAPSTTSSLNDALDGFNNSSGDTCGSNEPSCGDGWIDAGEQCDDGNTVDGDGCTANCTIECNYDPTLRLLCGDLLTVTFDARQ